mmetsp:Transcript_14648/g.33462  ORF Transcript_14648/g.33462 Transcript_14648/m.33462 type:complete len:219 (+) Transcript_14648:322-978(+)
MLTFAGRRSGHARRPFDHTSPQSQSVKTCRPASHAAPAPKGSTKLAPPLSPPSWEGECTGHVRATPRSQGLADDHWALGESTVGSADARQVARGWRRGRHDRGLSDAERIERRDALLARVLRSLRAHAADLEPRGAEEEHRVREADGRHCGAEAVETVVRLPGARAALLRSGRRGVVTVGREGVDAHAQLRRLEGVVQHAAGDRSERPARGVGSVPQP